MTIWNIEIDHVRVVGATHEGAGAAEIGALVTEAVRSALVDGTLPAGRTVHASVEVRAQSLAGGPAIAHSIARGVSRAVAGPSDG